jgi:hypothetical protein
MKITEKTHVLMVVTSKNAERHRWEAVAYAHIEGVIDGVWHRGRSHWYDLGRHNHDREETAEYRKHVGHDGYLAVRYVHTDENTVRQMKEVLFPCPISPALDASSLPTA